MSNHFIGSFRISYLIVSLLLLTTCGCGGSSGNTGRRPRVVDPEDPSPPVVGSNRTVTKPSPNPEATNGPGAAPSAANSAAPSPLSNAALAASIRRRESNARLSKIANALEKFRGKNGRYPDQVLVDREGKWLLSWRVQLLPFLGQQELYASFKFDEPWNSTHNSQLLNQIPDVFKSSERQDQKTCFQLLTGARTAYELPGGLAEKACPDGIINTLIVVETQPELAKPWTQPEDYTLDPLKIQQDLFTHREDGALVIFGGEVGPRLLPANISDMQLLGLITPAGKEKVDGETLSRNLTPEPYPDLLDNLRSSPVTRQLANLFSPQNLAAAQESAAAGNSTPKNLVASNTRRTADDDVDAKGRSPQESADERASLPSDDAITSASDQVRKLYADEYKTSKKVEDRRKFAKKLLDESKQVEADLPGYYVMLRASRDIAATAGDLATALEACERLKETFQIDEFAMFSHVLEQASPHLADASACQKLYDEAMRLADVALDHDDFSNAKLALKLAQSAARRTQKQDDLAAANRRDDEVNASRVAFQKIAPHLHTIIRSPENPTASGAVGRYTSLVKRDWEKGLGMLAKGDDQPLRKLAEDDLGEPSDHESQAALGDAWWDWSEQVSSPIEKSSARLRAAHWYKRAIPGLQPSLSRVRAERRVAEIENPVKSRTNRRSAS